MLAMLAMRVHHDRDNVLWYCDLLLFLWKKKKAKFSVNTATEVWAWGFWFMMFLSHDGLNIKISHVLLKKYHVKHLIP